jgi:hypothetical protein
MIAGTFNFMFGRRWVFKSVENPISRAIRYGFLVIVLMLISYGLITPLVTILNIHPLISKAIAEGTIFLLSFAAQAVFVFAPLSPNTKPSDWDDYYNKPYKTAVISRYSTTQALLKLIKQYHPEDVQHLCELGGANSCFYTPLVKRYPEAFYTIVDNNQRGLDLFRESYPNQQKANLLLKNVLDLSVEAPFSDVVFSVGLIEHFDTHGTAQAIASHFKCSLPGSIVIITFPTPTVLYRFARRISEIMGWWRFPDERPLSIAEVTNSASEYGEVIYKTINWNVVFTQAIVVFRTTKM